MLSTLVHHPIRDSNLLHFSKNWTVRFDHNVGVCVQSLPTLTALSCHTLHIIP